jgi:hypothetical protein
MPTTPIPTTPIPTTPRPTTPIPTTPMPTTPIPTTPVPTTPYTFNSEFKNYNIWYFRDNDGFYKMIDLSTDNRGKCVDNGSTTTFTTDNLNKSKKLKDGTIVYTQNTYTICNPNGQKIYPLYTNMDITGGRPQCLCRSNCNSVNQITDNDGTGFSLNPTIRKFEYNNVVYYSAYSCNSCK